MKEPVYPDGKTPEQEAYDSMVALSYGIITLCVAGFTACAVILAMIANGTW